MPTLDWLNRAEAFNPTARVPYRLLEQASVHASVVRTAPEPVQSALVEDEGAASTQPPAVHDNVLIQGDNLEALKALLPFYRGQVKCIFIDPPYNTKSAFEHYDDNLEHAQWLSMMLPRLQLLRELLREDGSIWVTIDDNEGHYLKVLMDEVFGRGNFIATIALEKDKGGRGDADISTSQDMVLAYAARRSRWTETRNLLERTLVQAGRFRNPDNDPRGPWRQGDDGTAKSGTEKQRFPITLPSGRTVVPKQGRYWAFSEETFAIARRENRAYFGKNGNRLPLIKRYATVVREGVAPRTWWTAEEAGTNQSAKRNLDTAPCGFALATSRGRYFPDFIAELLDGSLAVVEYKGAHLLNDPYEIEKRQVGELWARTSQGKCRFGQIAMQRDGLGMSQQLDVLLL